MAGKTTFLKSISICIYLAHLGMAVPAESMKLQVFDGLFTSIDTKDNLAAGYSYFYSEVKRVKQVAERLKNNEKIFVVFDELFRGTNIKDAFDCSSLVIEGFKNSTSNSNFIISSHIIELQNQIDFNKVFFMHFKGDLYNQKLMFDYTIKSGVSDQRLGLIILKSEGIEELFKNGNF